MTHWARYVELLGQAAADGLTEVWFRCTHPPGHLAHESLKINSKTLAQSVARGAEFIRRSQHHDGSFRGFLLTPGASTGWVTAHTLFVLEHVPALESVCRKGARYLHNRGLRDGGWAYNRKVAFDADSSAQALLALHRYELKVPSVLVNRVVSMQSRDGGFPTYAPSGADGAPATGWEASHPDVTLLVVEMLKRFDAFDARRELAAEWLLGQLHEGVLAAYWWVSPAYILWAQVKVGFSARYAIAAARDLLPWSGNIPDLPMLLFAAMEDATLDQVCIQGITKLLSLQRADGSWECQPCLRVTDPQEFDARMAVNGRSARDRRRLFSTAHCVAALSRAATQYGAD